MDFYSGFNEAIRTAREANRMADAKTAAMVSVVKGRLRRAHECTSSRGMSDDLAALKKELSKFDSRTKTWKD